MSRTFQQLTAKQGSDALGDDKSFGATARQSRFGLRYQGGDVLGVKLSGEGEFCRAIKKKPSSLKKLCALPTRSS
jgi:hypothetical protein